MIEAPGYCKKEKRFDLEQRAGILCLLIRPRPACLGTMSPTALHQHLVMTMLIRDGAPTSSRRVLIFQFRTRLKQIIAERSLWW